MTEFQLADLQTVGDIFGKVWLTGLPSFCGCLKVYVFFPFDAEYMV